MGVPPSLVGSAQVRPQDRSDTSLVFRLSGGPGLSEKGRAINGSE